MGENGKRQHKHRFAFLGKTATPGGRARSATKASAAASVPAPDMESTRGSGKVARPAARASTCGRCPATAARSMDRSSVRGNAMSSSSGRRRGEEKEK